MQHAHSQGADRLCVPLRISGQCFSSEAWGGRSANRGQCAQACRLPYGLIVDGQLRDLGDVKYLLSPQARPSPLQLTRSPPTSVRNPAASAEQLQRLAVPAGRRAPRPRHAHLAFSWARAVVGAGPACGAWPPLKGACQQCRHIFRAQTAESYARAAEERGQHEARVRVRAAPPPTGQGGNSLARAQDLMAVEQIPALLAAGVACLKIEGRLKGPEYVALTTRVYRDAVDAAWAALPAAPAARSAPAQPGGRRDDAGGAAPLEEGGRAAAAGPPGAQQLADLQQVGRVSGV